jgi:hypothetical protein
MNYTYIILGVLLLIILYVLYTTLLGSNTTVVSSKTYLKGGVPSIAMSTLAKPGSTQYNFQLWIYVNSLTNGETTIFQKDSINLKLDSQANLKLYMDGLPNNPLTVTTNFALQRWEHVIVSVANSLLDVYLDGKLIKSIQLDGIPSINPNAQISFGDGDIYIAGFNRPALAMDPQTAWNTYLSGNGNNVSSMFSNYGLNVHLTKDSLTQQKFILF